MSKSEVLQTQLERYCIDRTLAESTRVSYLAAAKLFDNWVEEVGLGGITVADIDIDLVNRFLSYYAGTVGSRETVRSKRRIVIALLNHFLEPQRRTIESRFIRNPKVSETVKDTWKADEVARLMTAAAQLPGIFRRLSNTTRGEYFCCMAAVAWETAARRGDLVRLTVAAIRSGDSFNFIQNKTQGAVVYRVSDQTRSKILRMPHVAGGAKLVFPPWGRTKDCSWQLESITKSFSKAMKMAELSSSDGPMKKLRRSSITDVECRTPGTGYLHAGHKSSEITRQHYLDPTRIRENTPSPTPISADVQGGKLPRARD